MKCQISKEASKRKKKGCLTHYRIMVNGNIVKGSIITNGNVFIKSVASHVGECKTNLE